MIVWHLKLVGALLIGLALAHLTFPKRFDWGNDLAKLQLLNRQMFWVHCFFLCLTLTLMGSLCLLWPQAFLEGGELRRLVSGGFAFFWFMRLLIQFFVYDPQLWRDKSFETVVHVVFGFLWSYFTLVFLWVFVTSP